MHSPRVVSIEVDREGSVRRAKLTYLRQRVGKSATMVKEKETRRTVAKRAAPAVVSAPAPAAPAAEPAAEPAAATPAATAAPAV